MWSTLRLWSSLLQDIFSGHPFQAGPTREPRPTLFFQITLLRQWMHGPVITAVDRQLCKPTSLPELPGSKCGQSHLTISPVECSLTYTNTRPAPYIQHASRCGQGSYVYTVLILRMKSCRLKLNECLTIWTHLSFLSFTTGSLPKHQNVFTLLYHRYEPVINMFLQIQCTWTFLTYMNQS